MKHAPKDYEGECEQRSRGSKKERTRTHRGGIGLDREQTLVKRRIDVNRNLDLVIHTPLSAGSSAN